MSNKVLRTTTARRVVRHTMQIVDSQPTTTGVVMVTRDPHEEGFDIGPHISVALQQKTGNFKMATESRTMQWSALTEEKQKSQLSQPEFRFIKTIIM